MNYPAISGFEITSVLGIGGMGTVYLARQLSLNRLVAIKILPAYLSRDSSYVKRFQQEARAAAQIKHPGIVQVYDAGEDQGLFYFVMEYISGETAAHRVRRKGWLDEESVLLIGESVAVALEYAWHEARLVHRDIKPDNILIDGDGTVKLADLGLAKLMGGTGSEGKITLSHSMIGTPHYCSPEQARGEYSVDCRADIYALGATMYHLITGRSPFSDTSGVSAMLLNITDYIQDPMDCNPDVSEAFSWLLEKAMAKNRDCRYHNWHDMLDDIDHLFKGKPIASEQLSPGQSTIARSKRRTMPGRSARIKYLKSMRMSEIRSIRDAIASSASSSLRFRVFLVIAAVFTVILFLICFGIEYRRRSLRLSHEKTHNENVTGIDTDSATDKTDNHENQMNGYRKPKKTLPVLELP